MDIQNFLEELEGRGFNFQDKSYTEFGFNDEVLNMVYEMYCAGKEAQKVAVPQWLDYTKQSPSKDGRYQIFINGEQLIADWETPYGFSEPYYGCALIQELITHWAELPQSPVAKELK